MNIKRIVPASALTLACVFQPVFGDVITVTPGQLGPWILFPAGTPNIEFVEGPGNPPSGTGSAQFSAGPAGTLTRLHNNAIGKDTPGIQVSDIEVLSYSTWVQSTVNPDDSEAPFLTLQFLLDGATTPTNFLFMPRYQQRPVQAGKWQNWNARHGLWWPNLDPAKDPDSNPELLVKLDDFLGGRTHALAYNPNGNAVRLAVGASGGAPEAVRARWKDFVGNVDKFEIRLKGTASPERHDFEPAAE